MSNEIANRLESKIRRQTVASQNRSRGRGIDRVEMAIFYQLMTNSMLEFFASIEHQQEESNPTRIRAGEWKQGRGNYTNASLGFKALQLIPNQHQWLNHH